jgi:hypothetical protein
MSYPDKVNLMDSTAWKDVSYNLWPGDKAVVIDVDKNEHADQINNIKVVVLCNGRIGHIDFHENCFKYPPPQSKNFIYESWNFWNAVEIL